MEHGTDAMGLLPRQIQPTEVLPGEGSSASEQSLRPAFGASKALVCVMFCSVQQWTQTICVSEAG